MNQGYSGTALIKRKGRRLGVTLGMVACAVVGAVGNPVLALADDWGCQVMLCLSDPRGPETESACVPPIEKLWTALRKGNPFPTCDFSSSYNDLPADLKNAIPASVMQSIANSNSGASNTYASASYCREDMLHWGGPEQSELLCSATGAINVTIDGVLFTRVWWDTGSQGKTLTEYYGQGSTQTQYDPTKAAEEFMQQQYQASGGGGGNH